MSNEQFYKCNNNKDKFPLVSILLAVYKPREDWFIEQLISLNRQTYENLELIIYDDCPECPVNEELIKKYITNFKYSIIRGKVNQGSNKAFEELTKVGNGKYFAYCDQDDIWKINKIKILVTAIEMNNGVLAYSDMSVIDGKNCDKYVSLLQAKPRLHYISGNNLMEKFFFKNCISGCCMLVQSYVAKNSVPFSDTLIHDQWIATVASMYGEIVFINEPLVKYRIHGNNQTGSLKGINTKNDYYTLRVLPLIKRVNDLKSVINKFSISADISRIEEFCNSRINKNLLKVYKYRDLCKGEAIFEILIKYMPSWCVRFLLSYLK